MAAAQPVQNLGPQGFPIDFNSIRRAMVDTVQKMTGLIMIEEMPETQGAKRPPKPYMSYRVSTPATHYGDDSATNVLDTSMNPPVPTSVVNLGGPRKMTVEFNSYAINKDDAYNYMAQWQQALETVTVQSMLRAAGIAVWVNGDIKDVSALLNTGFEGRANMTVNFGIAFNIKEDRGYMDSVPVQGTVTTDGGVQEDVGPFTTTVTQGE